jgi:hypothetical protein
MAHFCLATRMKPEDYYNLTLEEYQAYITALEERNRQ